ncbi:redox-sensitive transcriptional activator SoxR [Shewanella sp. 10N.286.51.B7]|uniref:redox-sensitive transcriptional activator SoxR n=1 Tax=Shewanella sp. 10N.286.51.B7 TaxID=1880836 RepID=UPI000C8512AF|nr:redox-sensitive transcriptional activator SoxR [Shewanella sp. 10N.286.51.B7]PMG76664.1 redox-sensitive transcriptional activator SoxR [Shewanella sp. 10N.286.51.B7]
MLNEADLTVGQVAKRCGIKVSSLHFYETKGLISSLRNQGNQRRYRRDVIRRISVIKAAQKMGVSLQEIKQALSFLPNERTPTKEDWAKLSQAWHDKLTQRIHYLTELRDSLNGCIGCGCLSMKSCPIYNPEDALGIDGVGSVILDNSVKK